MDTYLQAVHSFDIFDGPDPFDLIQLSGVITNTINYDASKYSSISVVVQCYTPYCDTSGKRLLLLITPGKKMVVDTILGDNVIAK